MSQDKRTQANSAVTSALNTLHSLRSGGERTWRAFMNWKDQDNLTSRWQEITWFTHLLLPLLVCSTCAEYCYAFRHSQTSKQQRRPLEAFHRFMTSWSLLSLEIVLMPSINTNTQCKHMFLNSETQLIDLKTTSRGWLFFECLGSCSGCADAYLGHPCLRQMWLAEGSMFRQGVWCNVVSLVSTQNGLGIKQVKLRTYPCNNATTIFTGVLWSFWVVLTGCFFISFSPNSGVFSQDVELVINYTFPLTIEECLRLLCTSLVSSLNTIQPGLHSPNWPYW